MTVDRQPPSNMISDADTAYNNARKNSILAL